MCFEDLYKRAEALSAEGRELRRDLHRYPETCFLEYRTASVIVSYLRALGVTVLTGDTVNDTSETAGLPCAEEEERCMRRAVEEGADRAVIEEMTGGKTGVVGVIDGTAEGAGQTVALRFDMDANEVEESCDPCHRPMKEDFRSRHAGAMHACGHDGHVAIGLLLARLLTENRDKFRGRVKLIFQPAEEGVRGAESMARRGVVDDVDVLLSGHIGLAAGKSKTLVASVGEFLAAGKYDAVFTGRSSHAGAAPEEGRNALLAAAQASLALHAIPRHSKGASRVNVGVLSAGTGRNVIPERAVMQFETRGATEEIGDFMEKEAVRIVHAAAELYGVSLSLARVAGAGAFEPDEAFAHELCEAARAFGIYREVAEYAPMNASEDCTVFLSRVKERGGRASYLLFGADLAAGHHNAGFDFSEDVIHDTAALLAALAIRYAEGTV